MGTDCGEVAAHEIGCGHRITAMSDGGQPSPKTLDNLLATLAAA